MSVTDITYVISPPVTNDDLNLLFDASWQGFIPRDFEPILSRSLAYLCAFQGERLIGFVNLAWDGGIHAFLLDTTVHPDVRRQGIGSVLVREAVRVARERGMEWLHADYEPPLSVFYRDCGFIPTEAGLIALQDTP
jgi:GNAT superfamily N-acetyltransferase